MKSKKKKEREKERKEERKKETYRKVALESCEALSPKIPIFLLEKAVSLSYSFILLS